MKIFTTAQIAQIDAETIRREPIKSIDLMERAARRLFEAFIQEVGADKKVFVIAGPGNNGGDGLALARMLLQYGYEVEAVLLHNGKMSADCRTNRDRLRKQFSAFLVEQQGRFMAPRLSPRPVIIDALFGSGLSRKLEGAYADAVKWINRADCPVYAVDIPSGLGGEVCGAASDVIVRAQRTFTLEFPKLALLLPENEPFVGKWSVVPIGLHPAVLFETNSNIFYIDDLSLVGVHKSRPRYAHKGDFGHLLLWVGQRGMAGAAVLATRAALRAGAGLVSVHSEESNRFILQTAAPEAIFAENLEIKKQYNAYALGPGLGMKTETRATLTALLPQINCPCVLDADALNIISEQPDLFEKIPRNSILTPHPKEFDRLFGSSENTLERMEKARVKAAQYHVYIIIKGANSILVTPNGGFYFNSTGNPGMATGGMGDVLTGIIAALLAQNYSPFHSARLALFLHGLAADLALDTQSEESLLPSDVIENLGRAFRMLKDKVIGNND